jgi:dTDP-4-amino-4,6-dideoxygalactose transaminase
LIGKPAASLPFPLERPDCRLYEWGRDGLWHGIGAIGLNPGDEVLVPAYHYGAEVAALQSRGLLCRFYEATEDLEPDPGELEELLGERTRALYLIHNLGLALDAARWRSWCDDRGLALIEDVAQGWLADSGGTPLGSWGDIAFYSPWKTYGLPDCGAVIFSSRVAGTPPAAVPSRRKPPVKRLVHDLARWAAQRSGTIAKLRSYRRTAGWDSAAEFALSRPHEGPSMLSLYMLRRSASDDTAPRRRANYRRLLDALGSNVPAPFDTNQEGSCPLGFPLTSADKAGLIQHLATKHIRAVNFWAVPHPLLPVERFPLAARRRASTLLLPVHQDLDDSDIDRIIDAVSEFQSRS